MKTELYKTFALGLLDIGAIKFGEFRLKLHEKNPAAPLSPIYVNLRLLRSFPQMMDSAVTIYTTLTSDANNFDLVADVPTAATPIVALISHQTRIPMISPRLDKKEHGVKSSIDGAFQKGQNVLLVDDLITQADSKMEAISVLKNSGLNVAAVAVLVDREQGGARELTRQGYKCYAAFTLSELLTYYIQIDRIDVQKYKEILAYIHGT